MDENLFPNVTFEGTPFERKVITFEERKKISYPSKSGLYVAEILMLQYCSYGAYPNPRNGYPRFWWFEYGIKDVDAVLATLELRDFIILNSKGKYSLTGKGEKELSDNAYVSYMHKHKNKTTEGNKFGVPFNVWEVNRTIGEQGLNWREVVVGIEQERNDWLQINAAKSYVSFDDKIAAQDKQIVDIQRAESAYCNNPEELISFWENIWSNGGLLFNGSRWTFRLADLYIQQKRYDDALLALEKIDNPNYTEKKAGYIQRVEKLKTKIARKKRTK